MCAERINLVIVCMEKHVDIDILKKFVVIRSVVFLIVKRDTLTFAILTENLEDVNLQHIVSTVITSKLMINLILLLITSTSHIYFHNFDIHPFDLNKFDPTLLVLNLKNLPI